MSTHYASATDTDCFKRSRCICMVFGVTLTPGANKSPFFCAYVSLLYSTFMCRSNTIVCWDYITKNWNRWDREQSKMKMNFHFSKEFKTWVWGGAKWALQLVQKNPPTHRAHFQIFDRQKGGRNVYLLNTQRKCLQNNSHPYFILGKMNFLDSKSTRPSNRPLLSPNICAKREKNIRLEMLSFFGWWCSLVENV